MGLSGPYVSDVVKPATALRNWVAVTSGYEIEHLLSRYCEMAVGRRAYYYYMLNKTFGGICQLTGSPFCLIDVPQSDRGGPYVNFMKIGSSIMRTGPATIRLGIAHAGRVQVNIYDVAGRKVKTLADRVFPQGEQSLAWDGTNNEGQKIARGVYFVRASTDPTPGRIIVLTP